MSEAVNSEIRGEDLQSRFQVMDRPTLHPGICIVCGSAQRPVIVLDPEVDFADLGFGALMLCSQCITQAASKFPAPETSTISLEDHKANISGVGKMIADELLQYVDDLNRRFGSDYFAQPVYGSADSPSESPEPADVTDTKPELRDESETSDGSDLEASDNAEHERSAGVPGSSNDGPLGKQRSIFDL